MDTNGIILHLLVALPLTTVMRGCRCFCQTQVPRILVLFGTATAVLATCVAATATATPLLLDVFDLMKIKI